MACIVWFLRAHARYRRNGRILAELAKKYQQPQDPSQPRQTVTVAELIARTHAEGHATHLHWADDTQTPQNASNNEWPTAVLPQMEPEE